MATFMFTKKILAGETLDVYNDICGVILLILTILSRGDELSLLAAQRGTMIGCHYLEETVGARSVDVIGNFIRVEGIQPAG